MSLVAYDSSEEENAGGKTKRAKKIFIPSLREFNDDEETVRGAIRKGSNLLAMLPQPLQEKSTINKYVVPEILMRNKKPVINSKQIVKNRKVTQPTPSQGCINSAPDVSKPYDGLNNDEFRKMLTQPKERQEIVMKDSSLMKSLTEPSGAGLDIEDSVNNTCKKKHHITYLAQQAKANEERLNHEWSQSKYKRQLSRLKYGF